MHSSLDFRQWRSMKMDQIGRHSETVHSVCVHVWVYKLVVCVDII